MGLISRVSSRTYRKKTMATPVKVIKSQAVKHLFTRLRDKHTETEKFVYYANRLMRILAEEGIAELPQVQKTIETPCGEFEGCEIDENNCIAVSIIRAGDSLLDAVRFCLPSVRVGKILIQRNEATKEKEPILYYAKFPKDIAKRDILLVDPMLASGGSAMCAVKCLLDRGVKQDKIIFLNVITCPEGVKKFHETYPEVKVVTAAMDDGLDENKYIVPGVGDWGDRFYGTIEE